MSSHFDPDRFLMRRIFLPVLLALGLCGCAKFPAGGVAGQTTRLIFDMTVAGKLRTGNAPGEVGLPYVYLIALRLSKDTVPTTSGPVPVVSPGGNGFVAGNCTHYILWNPAASPQFQIWQFKDSATLNESFQIGTPINATLVNEGDRKLHFELDMSQLVAVADVPLYKSVQVNFLTMNNTNTSGSNRLWDALGDGRISTQINNPVLVRLNANQVYNNLNQLGLEPTGDVLDPDLDISDWGVEVRLQ